MLPYLPLTKIFFHDSVKLLILNISSMLYRFFYSMLSRFFFLFSVIVVSSPLFASAADPIIATDVQCSPIGCVGTSDIASGAVTAAKIANNAITTQKILDSTLTSIDISDNSLTTTDILDGLGSGLDADLFDGLESSQFLRSDASGSMITTGNTSLLIHANDAVNDRNPALELKAGNTDAGAFSILKFSKTAGGAHEALQLQNNSDVAVMTLLGNGNVGIGTTTPTGKLTIDSASMDLNKIVLYDYIGAPTPYRIGVESGGGIVYNIDMADANHFHDFRFNNLPAVMRIRGDGKVGIGTSSPETTLGVNGTFSATGYVGIGTTYTGKPLTVYAGTNDPLYMMSDANHNWYLGPNVAGQRFGLYDVNDAKLYMKVESNGDMCLGAC